MACFKCKSNHLGSRSYLLRELDSNSPSRGKNKKYITLKVKEVFCKDCFSKEMSYEGIKGG